MEKNKFREEVHMVEMKRGEAIFPAFREKGDLLSFFKKKTLVWGERAPGLALRKKGPLPFG